MIRNITCKQLDIPNFVSTIGYVDVLDPKNYAARVLPDFNAYRILVRQFSEWPQLSGWVCFGFPGNETDWQQLADALRCG